MEEKYLSKEQARMVGIKMEHEDTISVIESIKESFKKAYDPTTPNQ